MIGVSSAAAHVSPAVRPAVRRPSRAGIDSRCPCRSSEGRGFSVGLVRGRLRGHGGRRSSDAADRSLALRGRARPGRSACSRTSAAEPPTPPWTSPGWASASPSTPVSATTSSDVLPPRPWWLTAWTSRPCASTRCATSQTLIVNVAPARIAGSFTPWEPTWNSPPRTSTRFSFLPPACHIGYFLILPELDAGGLAERFARARKSGTRTLLDVATPGPGNYLESSANHRLAAHRRLRSQHRRGHADPGRGRPGSPGPDLPCMGARRVVITRGDRGLISVSDEQSVEGVGLTPWIAVTVRRRRRLQRRLHRRPAGRDRSELGLPESPRGPGCAAACGPWDDHGVFDRSEAEEFSRSDRAAVETLA